mmetsp:Transcript_11705/g.25683  ORF Transcript_11705/g.25683 Transcript_11705/m.25683 type:complete len:240 (+) Transcript_11705:3910-4629(+)
MVCEVQSTGGHLQVHSELVSQRHGHTLGLPVRDQLWLLLLGHLRIGVEEGGHGPSPLSAGGGGYRYLLQTRGGSLEAGRQDPHWGRPFCILSNSGPDGHVLARPRQQLHHGLLSVPTEVSAQLVWEDIVHEDPRHGRPLGEGGRQVDGGSGVIEKPPSLRQKDRGRVGDDCQVLQGGRNEGALGLFGFGGRLGRADGVRCDGRTLARCISGRRGDSIRGITVHVVGYLGEGRRASGRDL